MKYSKKGFECLSGDWIESDHWISCVNTQIEGPIPNTAKEDLPLIDCLAECKNDENCIGLTYNNKTNTCITYGTPNNNPFSFQLHTGYAHQALAARSCKTNYSKDQCLSIEGAEELTDYNIPVGCIEKEGKIFWNNQTTKTFDKFEKIFDKTCAGKKPYFTESSADSCPVPLDEEKCKKAAQFLKRHEAIASVNITNPEIVVGTHTYVGLPKGTTCEIRTTSDNNCKCTTECGALGKFEGRKWCNVEDCTIGGKLWSWDYCDCDETITGKGQTYRGCQNKTRGGYTCAKWTAGFNINSNDCKKNKVDGCQHRHTITQNPDKGISNHNYCRNPDNGASIWCYTTDKDKRWDYCDAKPLIKDSSSSYTTKEACEDQCDKDSSCSAFVYNPDTRFCKVYGRCTPQEKTWGNSVVHQKRFDPSHCSFYQGRVAFNKEEGKTCKGESCICKWESTEEEMTLNDCRNKCKEADDCKAIAFDPSSWGCRLFSECAEEEGDQYDGIWERLVEVTLTNENQPCGKGGFDCLCHKKTLTRSSDHTVYFKRNL